MLATLWAGAVGMLFKCDHDIGFNPFQSRFQRVSSAINKHTNTFFKLAFAVITVTTRS